MVVVNALIVILSCIATPARNDLIPLDTIWALDMPGTRDVRKLDPRKDKNSPREKTAISHIGLALSIGTEKRAKAGRCFLVMGHGKEALLNATKVLVDKAKPAKKLTAEKNVSLVFYSYSAPGYVHLDSVSHANSRVKVKYEIVTHQTLEATVHFALIPLGKLQAGKLAVDVAEVKPRIAYSNQALADRAVCDSCVFTIEKEAIP